MLHLHRADRADALVEALGATLARPPADPFAPERVAVPTRGMERWLAQRLSAVLGASPGRGDGVCANVDFPSPWQLAERVVAGASGVEPDADPWAPERLVWPLLDIIDGCLHEPWLAVLAAHLRAADGTPRRARRLTSARHLAGLFDRYALHRPDMVRGWAAGEEGDGHWQAQLWRRLRAHLALPSPAERLAEACERLRREPGAVDLPERLCAFGLTRLPAGHLAVLRAIAARRAVHLFLLHPSPALWQRIAATLDPAAPVVRRADDPTVALPRHRLLASWGRDSREMQIVLGGAGEDELADHDHSSPRGGGTLLERLQADVHADAPAPGPPAPGEQDARGLLDPTDASLQIHACHGRARQVEVLRDALLHLLAEDDTLEPRDIVVMCPDIEAFAPLLQATFGAVDPDDDEDAPGLAPRPTDLRVRLADRALRQTNPVLTVVADLLELAEGRCSASEVLDLADRVPVRRRFDFDDDDLARLQEWAAQSGIRWGLDAAHRAAYQLDKVAAGTWSAGLDRILLGAAMTEDGCWRYGEVLPLDDVEGAAIDLAGRLAELVDRLTAALDALQGPHTIDGWNQAITEAASALTATAPRDAWQHAQLTRLLAEAVDEASGGAAADLSLPEVRALLADRLAGAPTRANFRTGHLTVCTMLPMRSVPHRVVCLLGLDDDVFPRQSARDGDDLMLDDPRVGERDPRHEDRQLLLDALMAAQERLVITYTGRDERSNEPRPPAVPVGELLDAVERTARTPDGAPLRERLVTHHPLQPFDPRNFAAGALAADGAWSFDPAALEGARALSAERRPPPPFLAGPLPARPEQAVEVERLAAFAGRPVRAFLRQRLEVSVGRSDDEIADALPVELDGLQKWGVGQRLLDEVLRGTSLEEAIVAERARGALPPGTLADAVLEEVCPIVQTVAASAAAVLGDRGVPGSADVRLDLPGGRLLSGTVPGVSGDRLVAVAYSRVDPRHRLETWVRWLALTAARPDVPVTARTIGRAPAGSRVATVRLTPPPGDPGERRAFALEHIAVLLDLYDRGMREALPIACRSSAAWAHAARQGEDAAAAAAAEWTSRFNFDKEDRQPEHVLAFGGEVAFDDLLRARPREDEHGEGWAVEEPTRFGRLARRLWAGPLFCEEHEQR